MYKNLEVSSSVGDTCKKMNICDKGVKSLPESQISHPFIFATQCRGP